jgi:hypothetical protein
MSDGRLSALLIGLCLTFVAVLAVADHLFVYGKHATSLEGAYWYSAPALLWWLAYFGWRS